MLLTINLPPVLCPVHHGPRFTLVVVPNGPFSLGSSLSLWLGHSQAPLSGGGQLVEMTLTPSSFTRSPTLHSPNPEHHTSCSLDCCPTSFMARNRKTTCNFPVFHWGTRGTKLCWCWEVDAVRGESVQPGAKMPPAFYIFNSVEVFRAPG